MFNMCTISILLARDKKREVSGELYPINIVCLLLPYEVEGMVQGFGRDAPVFLLYVLVSV